MGVKPKGEEPRGLVGRITAHPFLLQDLMEITSEKMKRGIRISEGA